MKTYTVSVNFGGYIGCDEEYKVDASSEEEAMELAMNLAVDDLSVEVVGVEDEEEAAILPRLLFVDDAWKNEQSLFYIGIIPPEKIQFIR